MASTSWQQMRAAAASAPSKGGGAAIPAGSYPFYVETAQYKTAGSGADMIEAVLRVIGGEYDGKRLWNNFVLSPDNPQALDIFFRHMEAMGIPGNVLDTLPEPPSAGLAYLAQLLVNRQGIAVVGFGKGDYADRNDVKDIKASNDPAQMGGMAPPIPGQAPVAAAPPAVPPQAPPAAVPPVQPVPPAAVPAPPAVPAPAPPMAQPVPPAAPAPVPDAPVPPAPAAPAPGVPPQPAPAPVAAPQGEAPPAQPLAPPF